MYIDQKTMYRSFMNAEWTPTRRGGFRRSHAGVAQKMGTSRKATQQTRAVATADVDGVVERDQYSEERLPNPQEVGGSIPSSGTKKFIFKANEKLGLPGCEYLIRTRFETPWGSIRLHHWIGPDDDRAKHDHPWSFVTFVLRGGYTDASPCFACGGNGYDAVANGAFDCTECKGTGEIREHLKAPAIQYRDAEHQHTVFPDDGGCWTVIVTGPKIRNWGFWVNGKFRSHRKYFWKFGHHPCD